MEHAHQAHHDAGAAGTTTTVLEVSGVQWASEASVVKAVLGRRPGVVAVDPNPVAQTATLTFDPNVTSVAELRRWVEECGYHCAGQSVPAHLCDPMAEPGRAPASPATLPSPHEAMGHGGHDGMSMAAMAHYVVG